MQKTNRTTACRALGQKELIVVAASKLSAVVNTVPIAWIQASIVSVLPNVYFTIDNRVDYTTVLIVRGVGVLGILWTCIVAKVQVPYNPSFSRIVSTIRLGIRIKQMPSKRQGALFRIIRCPWRQSEVTV